VSDVGKFHHVAVWVVNSRDAHVGEQLLRDLAEFIDGEPDDNAPPDSYRISSAPHGNTPELRHTTFVFSGVYDSEDDASAHWSSIRDNWENFDDFQKFTENSVLSTNVSTGKIFEVS
jgi:hypothetical protein